MYYLRKNSLVGGLWLAVLCILFLQRAYGSSADAIWPEASGTYVLQDGNLNLDCSHMEDGYVMVSVITPSANRMKLQVVYNGAQLLYDIQSTGDYDIIPLQLGSGYYSVSLFENVTGTKYAAGGKVDLSVTLSDERVPFLVANQYVNYTQESPSVARSDEMAEGKSQKELFEEVCGFMVDEFAYDYVRAQTISPAELPEVDSCFINRLGICQDLSAVMISMLRVQGIPSRLMIGYADGYYHAWTVSIVDGEEQFFDPTAQINAFSANEYVLERFY